MAADTHNLKFKIDDHEYEMPMLDDLDMDEWQILYDYTGLILDDFAPAADQAPVKENEIRLEAELKSAKTSEKPEIAKQLAVEQARRAEDDGPNEKDRQRRTSQPGFTRAMLHIGYRRAHPELKPDAIKQVTGEAKLIHVLEALNESAPEEDETPLASTTEPEPSSPRRPVASKETTSPPSPKNSGERDVQRETTGTAA